MKNQLINIDYLELNYNTNLHKLIYQKTALILNKEATLILTNTLHNNFKISAKLLISGFTVATLFFKPRKSILSPETTLVKISNSILYSNQLNQYLSYIKNVLQWKLNNITRLDIAADFLNTNYLVFLKKFLFKENIKLVGKTKKAITVHNLIGSKPLETISFGSGKSSKKLTVYNKSLELIENKKTNQDHKKKYFLRNFKTLKNIERVELKLKSKLLKNIKLTDLLSHKFLVSLFEKHLCNYFVFKKKTVLRTQTISLIDFSLFKEVKLFKLPTIKKANNYYRKQENTTKHSNFHIELLNTLFEKKII